MICQSMTLQYDSKYMYGERHIDQTGVRRKEEGKWYCKKALELVTGWVRECHLGDMEG